jgi:hypothetical protein
MSAALSLGQYLATLKSDSHAELSFLQFFFYPKNLPEAPHPLTLRLRLYRRHDKYQPNLRTLVDELISIEENASRREIFSDSRDLVAVISKHYRHELLESDALSLAAVRVGHL